MMEVPVYRRQVDISGAIPLGHADIGTAMAPGLAAADAIRTAGRSVDRLEEARRVNEISERTLQAAKELDELDAWADSQTDHEQIVPGYNEKLKEMQARYSREIKDPAVRTLFGREFQRMAIRGQSRVRDLAAKKERDYNHASLITTLDAYSDMIAQAADFESASEKVKYARVAIAGAAAAGSIDQVTAAKYDKDFVEKTQVNFIRREMLDDPEAVYKGLVEGAYPELDETRKTGLLKESRELAEAEQKKRIRILEHDEKVKEKAKKDAMESAYGDALVAYSQGTLNEVQVQRLISGRKIDPDKGSHLLSLIKGGADKAKDNPIVVGRIASALELGGDVSPDLDAALQRNEIKAETYISLKKQLGDRDFKRGLYHVNYALKPSDADQWTPDKHIRHAEAVEEYSSRVASGEPPMVVAKSVVENFTSDVRRTIRGIAAPRFLAGDKTSLDALRKAQADTAEAFRKGRLSVDDFNREAERISLLMDLATRLGQGDQAVPAELSDRAREALKKR